MNDAEQQVLAAYGWIDSQRWKAGTVTVRFLADSQCFNNTEEVIFAINQMLYDRFEGVYHEVVLE